MRNTARVEVHQARVFLATAEELHFGQAARRLRTSTPSVTRAIQQLERTLGAPLFARTTRSVALTAAGQALVEPARALVAADHRAVAAVAAVGRGEQGLVRIAFAGASTHVLVGVLAREARRRHPGIHLELHSQNYAQPALRRVLQGEVDIGLGRWDLRPSGIRTRPITQEQLVMAVPSSHPLAGASSVAFAQFAGDPFIGLAAHASSVLADRLARLSQAAGFYADVVQVAPDSLTAIALVAADLGVLLTLSSVARNAPNEHVRFLPLRDATLPVELRMAWRSEATRSPALDAVIELAARVLPAAAGPDAAQTSAGNSATASISQTQSSS